MTHPSIAAWRYILYALFVIVSASVSHAGLSWDRNQVEVTCQPEQASVTVSFGVHNSGDADVGVMRIRSSCSCTSVECNKAVLRPGESADVTATIHLGSLLKDVRRHLIVETEERGVRQLADLWIQIKFVPLATIEPERLVWHQGEMGTKRILARMLAKTTRIMEAKGPDGQPVQIERGSGDGEYELIVFPPSNGVYKDIHLITNVITSEGAVKMLSVRQSRTDQDSSTGPKTR